MLKTKANNHLLIKARTLSIKRLQKARATFENKFFKAENDWVVDFSLQKMKEIDKDITTLRSEIEEIRSYRN